MNRLLPPIVLTALLLTAGCIELEPQTEPQPEPSGSATATTSSAHSSSGASSAAGTSAPPGTMTAKEASATSASACSGSGSLDHCATRTHWISGDLTLQSLPITLTSFNGFIDVKSATADKWNLTVTLRARGETDAAARANLENIAFTWSHEKDGKHVLDAQARRKVPTTNNQEAATMSLTVPASVVVTLTGTTSNGPVTARDLQANDVRLATSNGGVTAVEIEAANLRLETSNGGVTITSVTADKVEVFTSNAGISATASAREMKFESSNGAMDLRLTPTASGKIQVSTSNGPIKLAVPEDAKHGYDLTASTSNGIVTCSLKDGSCSGSNTSKTFKTTNYSTREIQTTTTVTSSNSMITVSSL